MVYFDSNCMCSCCNPSFRWSLEHSDLKNIRTFSPWWLRNELYQSGVLGEYRKRSREKLLKFCQASLSMFQSIYIITALIFTFVCTSITLYKLILLPGRIKSAEKSLCFTSITISVTFLLVAVTQVCFGNF